jgi:hypothetical protein
MAGAHRVEHRRLWQPWRLPRIQAELRQPYHYDLPAGEIDRRFTEALREVKRTRLFKIEDEPQRKTCGTYTVVLKPGRRR